MSCKDTRESFAANDDVQYEGLGHDGLLTCQPWELMECTFLMIAKFRSDKPLSLATSPTIICLPRHSN